MKDRTAVGYPAVKKGVSKRGCYNSAIRLIFKLRTCCKTGYISTWLLLAGGMAFAQELPVEKIVQFCEETGMDNQIRQLEATIEHYMETPVMLNQCTEDELLRTGLLTPFQAYNIVRYREKYGPFFTIYELVAIPGINRELAQVLSRLSTISPAPYEGNSRMKGYFMTDCSAILPRSGAYEKTGESLPAYPGSPLKILHRTRLSRGFFNAGITYEKDPGERAFSGNRPEHIVGYIEMKPPKLLNHVVAGNFKLHRGLGLIHGLGFPSRGSGLQTGGFRTAYARPYGSAAEYGYLRGIYAAAKKGKLTIDTYCSSLPGDISFFNYSDERSLFDLLRETGYHRTQSERNGTKLAMLREAGGSAGISWQKGNIGISYARGAMQLTAEGLDSLGLGSERKSMQQAFSLSGFLIGNRTTFFMESALAGSGILALLTGLDAEVNPALKCYASLRYYGPGFPAFSPAAYGASGAPDNSAGINAGMEMALTSSTRLFIDTDISQTAVTWAGEQDNYPVSYNQVKLVLSPGENGRVEIRLKNKTTHRLTQKIAPPVRRSLGIKYNIELAQNMFFESKLVMAGNNLAGEGPVIRRNHPSVRRIKPLQGLAYQQVTIKMADRLQLKYRFMAFRVDDWENRIYLYEPGVRYSFSFPSWSGTGIQNLLVCSVRAGKKWVLRGKLAQVRYANQHILGTGLDQVPGNRKVQITLQIQLKV